MRRAPARFDTARALVADPAVTPLQIVETLRGDVRRPEISRRVIQSVSWTSWHVLTMRGFPERGRTRLSHERDERQAGLDGAIDQRRSTRGHSKADPFRTCAITVRNSSAMRARS